VVLGNAFGIDEGVVVDTHVRRVSNRLGLTEEQDPEKIERDLMAVVPRRTGPCSRTCSSSTDAGYARPANPTAQLPPQRRLPVGSGTTKHPADLVPSGSGLTSSPASRRPCCAPLSTGRPAPRYRLGVGGHEGVAIGLEFACSLFAAFSLASSASATLRVCSAFSVWSPVPPASSGRPLAGPGRRS
jgi:hypothetical protein